VFLFFFILYHRQNSQKKKTQLLQFDKFKKNGVPESFQ
jgi:hypothetical protein